jgi:hypothetical protein
MVARSDISTAEMYRLLESGYEARAELVGRTPYIILTKGADVVHWEATAGGASFFVRDFNQRVEIFASGSTEAEPYHRPGRGNR